VRLGCEDAARDASSNTSDPTARWVTYGLLDAVFAAVAKRQGVAPADVSAAKGVPDDLQVHPLYVYICIYMYMYIYIRVCVYG